MKDVTPFFITTGRMHAERSRRRLERQRFAHPIVTIDGVRPMSAAYGRALDATTEYAFTLDDDVVLADGIAAMLVDELRRARMSDPRVYRILPRIVDQLTGATMRGGAHVFHVPIARELGVRDTPHVMLDQRRRAEAVGYRVVVCERFAGVHLCGSAGDVYKRYFWLQVRAAAGQRNGVTLDELLERARRGDTLALWTACLGFIDGMRAGPIASSKDEAFAGPLGAAIDFEHVTAAGVRERVLAALEER